ncbi:MAG: hypothetical protein GF417_10695 [Candidatus Latescibacteria bacterium]|nr:hypothetical protein [Candidatus Latescibacterota bacterium]
MKVLIKNIIPFVIILSIITSCMLIPSEINARYEIRREEAEQFGEPGDDPTLSTDPLSGGESAEISVSSSNDSLPESEDVPLMVIHLKIFFNQLTIFIF